MVHIRRYGPRGSEVTTYDTVAEAEKVLEAARDKGAFVVDEETEQVVHRGDGLKDEHTYAIVPQVQGG